MMRLDLYWTTNPNWYETIQRSDGSLYDALKPEAPQKAKESYANYSKQILWAAKEQARTKAHII